MERLAQRLQSALPGLIIATGVALLAFYNWRRFGSPLHFGYGDGFSASLLQGLTEFYSARAVPFCLFARSSPRHSRRVSLFQKG